MNRVVVLLIGLSTALMVGRAVETGSGWYAGAAAFVLCLYIDLQAQQS